MTDKACSVDECIRPLIARGLCSLHYSQWRKASSLCAVDGCGKGETARGLCSAHYANLMRFGQPVRLRFVAPRQVCDVDDCFDPAPRTGIYCKAHLVQMRRTGEPPKSRQVKNCARCGHPLQRYANKPNATCDLCKTYYHATKHGLTGRRYAEMGEEQGWCCYLCRRNLRSGRGGLHIDHDHSHCAGTFGCAQCVRRLLCHECNTALGLMRDDAELLKRAATYIETHSSRIT